MRTLLTQLWWAIFAIAGLIWLVIIIQLAIAQNETVIIESDLDSIVVDVEEKVVETDTSIMDSLTQEANNLEAESAESFQIDTPASETNSGSKKESCICINSADEDKLVTLPGIGPVLAQRIVAFRTENGDFGNISDLIKVKGIGESKLNKIRNHICLQSD